MLQVIAIYRPVTRGIYIVAQVQGLVIIYRYIIQTVGAYEIKWTNLER